MDLASLPDDPLAMPPPYWRSAGWIFQVVDSLEALVELLAKLPEVVLSTNDNLDKHYARYPARNDAEGDAALDEFASICDALWALEHRIKLKTEVAILMTAIGAEDSINRFCVFNLPKEFAEALEKLAPAEKLTAALSALGVRRVRSTAAYAAVSVLSAWRNAFAHGHCVDRPRKTLRHNHLLSPEEYPGVPDSIESMLRLCGGYSKLARCLSRYSINPYTKGRSSDWSYVTQLLQVVSEYEFEGDNQVYEVVRR